MPIYSNTLKVTELARLERIQYRAAKLVTGALHFTSQEKLNAELGWESIKKRIDFLGLCLFQKIHLKQTRPLISKCMPKLDWEKKQITRSKGGYIPYKYYGNDYSNSFFPFYTKLWNNLPSIHQCKDLADFKIQLKFEIKPQSVRHFSKGSKLGNTLLTRLRVGRSDLNLHKFTIGQVDKPECLCRQY